MVQLRRSSQSRAPGPALYEGNRHNPVNLASCHEHSRGTPLEFDFRRSPALVGTDKSFAFKLVQP